MKQLDLFKKINDENLIEYLKMYGYDDLERLCYRHDLSIDIVISELNCDIDKLIQYFKYKLAVYKHYKDEFSKLLILAKNNLLTDEFFITLFEFGFRPNILLETSDHFKELIRTDIKGCDDVLTLISLIINFININK